MTSIAQHTSSTDGFFKGWMLVLWKVPQQKLEGFLTPCLATKLTHLNDFQTIFLHLIPRSVHIR